MKRQRTNILAALVFIVTGWAQVFVYYPACQKLKVYQDEFRQADRQVRQIESAMSSGQTPLEMIAMLREEALSLGARIPAKEEATLDALQTFAKEARMELLELTIREKEPCAGSENQMISVQAGACHQVGLNLKMRGLYRQVYDYLGLLQEKLPALITVDSLTLQRRDDVYGLDANIKINIYLLSSP